MEEPATHNTKISDSAYSKSSNSQSQRSSVSSKSRHSISSGSSGYGGHASSALGSGSEPFPLPVFTKRTKGEHKKKKSKSSTAATTAVTPIAEHENVASPVSMVLAGVPLPLPGTAPEETKVPEACSKRSSVSSHNGIALGADGVTPATAPGPKNEVFQMASLSCVNKFKTSKDVHAGIAEGAEFQFLSRPVVPEEKSEQILGSFEVKSSTENEGEFCFVVSMQDGVVVFTTPSISDVVGFPKDMWLGRSFIDFIHPKDCAAFTSHITSGVVTPLTYIHTKGGSYSGKNSFYCCLRRYRGLKSNDCDVTEKEVPYLPFQLNMTFREFVSEGSPPPDQEGTIDPGGVTGGCNNIFLVVTAKPILSAYKHAGETCVFPKFVTRHLASCKLCHVDPESMPYLGYLPHDILGKSVLDFYHPEDLPFLKEVYQIVMKEHTSSFRSKPYRFRAQNGCYVLLETEWSSFVNPWSQKLEFVIGQHRVLKGPDNANVFMAPDEDTQQISEEVLKESKIIQEEIKSLLSEMVKNVVQPERQQVSKRCRELSTFMETLIDDISKSDLKVDLPHEEESFSEHDSAMLGGISPHHDYCDSKSSTETPPSYNQLNYNDNMQRFFESKPKTVLSDESGESKIEANRSLMSTDEEGKSGVAADSSLGSSNRKSCSPVNGSGSSGSGHSSGSAHIGENVNSRRDTSATDTSQGSYKPPLLTEALLYRHNEDMEKKMVQKHKEQRNKCGEKENKLKKCFRDKVLQEHCHGVKRSGSHSWEGELHKASKHPHVEGGRFNPGSGGDSVTQCLNFGKQYPVVGSVPPLYQSGPNMNLWPPFSVTVTPIHPTAPCSTYGRFTANNMPTPPHMTNMFPVCYIPTTVQQAGISTAQCLEPREHPGPPQMPPPGVMLPGQQSSFIPQQVPYVNAATTVLYQYPPVYGGPHVMYPSMAVLQPATTLLQAPGSQSSIPVPATCNQESKSPVVMSVSGTTPCKFQRPASQATSVKAEPGSAMGSIASASVKRGMSESSKKEKSLCSPNGWRTSPNASQDGEKVMDGEDERRDRGSIGLAFCVTREVEGTGDDSSNSSFYSFLKTDNSDTSMKSSSEYMNDNDARKAEDMAWEKSENQQQLRLGPVLKEPPWMEEVRVTPDLVYRYQMKDQQIGDVLQADLQALQNIHQPFLVNDQLSQLYLDMELEGLSTKLKLEEGITSSSGSSVEDIQSNAPDSESHFRGRKKRRNVEYGKLVMIFEENAPFPPPCTK